jgi:hypothetical protein
MKVLPYASYSDPAAGYPDALEAAVTLLTVESRRGKGTGFALLKKAAQDVGWISRFVWPMIAMPVTLPDPAGTGESTGPRHLVFDLTGLIASGLPPFKPRETVDPAAVDGWRGMSAAEFAAAVEAQVAALKQGPRPTGAGVAASAGAMLQGAMSRVQGLVRRTAAGDELPGFVSGQSQLARDLLAHAAAPEAPDWPAPELARTLEPDHANRYADEMADRIRAYVAQAARIEEAVAAISDLGNAYPAELAERRDEVSYRYNNEIDAIRPEVERAVEDHRRSLESQLNAVMQRFSGSMATAQTELAQADQEIERYRALGKGYEAQLGDARRLRGEAQRRLDATKREMDGETKKVNDQFMSLINRENERLSSLAKQRDREIGDLNELQRKLEAALSSFRTAATAAAGADRKAAADIAGLAASAPDLPAHEPVEFGVPVYLARLDAQKATYIALPPVTISATRSLKQQATGLVSSLLGGVSLPSEQRSPRYDVFAKALVGAIEGTAGEAGAAVAASINDLAGSSSVLADAGFRDLALAGLDQLKAGRYLNDKQYEEQRQAISRMYGGH